MSVKMYINGKLVEGEGAPIDVINPATGKVVETIRGASVAQAQEALEAAKKAFKEWSHTSILERERWMHLLAEKVRERKEEFLDIMSTEGGRQWGESQGDWNFVPDYLEYFPEEAKRIYDEGLPQFDGHRDQQVMIIKRPIGVVVSHLAWNAPFYNLGSKLAPAMASGCTCVLRPSTCTPLASLLVGEICAEIGLPAGVVNILTGSASEVGNYLTRSEIPAMVSLIGSTETGKKIIQESATTIKHFSLELGGNAPVIVMPDADVDAVVNWAVVRKHKNAGQGCANLNRIFVHESLHDEFVGKLLSKVQEIRCDWGKEADPNAMGALMSEDARDRMLELTRDALDKGAELLHGGKIPEYLRDELRGGYFVEPTMLDKVTDDMRVFKEEVFGPIYAVSTFKTLEEVIERANNTEHGLSSYVFTHDTRTVMQCTEEMEFGEVDFNLPRTGGPNMPHVGIKGSGIGCVKGKYAMEEYYHWRRIAINP